MSIIGKEIKNPSTGLKMTIEYFNNQFIFVNAGFVKPVPVAYDKCLADFAMDDETRKEIETLKNNPSAQGGIKTASGVNHKSGGKSSLEILPKRIDVLDALGGNNQFRINIDVLNECFGANVGMYRKACWPHSDYLDVKGRDKKATVWMPKFYHNSSEWNNSISPDGRIIYEIAEPGKDEDWMNYHPSHVGKYRVAFVKEAPDLWYRFVGVFEDDCLVNMKHTYKRIATKIRLIGNPVHTIELLENEGKQIL